MKTKNEFVRERLELILFVLPAFIFLLIFVIYPFFQGAYYSFTSWNGVDSQYKMVGFKNYADAFKNRNFVNAIFFNLTFTVVALISQNVLGLTLAAFIEKSILFKKTFQAVFFLPNVIAQVVVAFTWSFVFTNVSKGLYALTKLSIFDLSWFGDPKMAFWSLVIVSLWMGAGYLMVIYIAGLQSIDASIIEASIVDGANTIQQLLRVKLPLLMPSIVISVFLVTQAAIKFFDLPMLMTQGGPARSTETMALNIYNEGFAFDNFGGATARAVILYLIVLILTMVQIITLKRREVVL